MNLNENNMKESSFEQLGLIQPILNRLEELKYTTPSPIQANTIPSMIEGRDVLGCAKTGSGKTAAFGLPLLQLLSTEKSKKIRALVLTPTRELAIQICDNMKKYGKNMDLKTGAIYGGVSQKPQVEMLQGGIDILIATPGRLLDLMNQGLIKLDQIQTIVLDEADQMLDMGFVVDIKKVIKQIPAQHQTVMFSATMPKSIKQLANTLLKDPVTVMQDEVTQTTDTVSQYVYYVDADNKLELLTKLLKSDEVTSAIVFTNTKHRADKVMKKLMTAGVRARAIHGDKGQNARQDALIQFKNRKIKALVATDVAARGIDISKLSHVFNYEIPVNPESYIHRIGRTGRAGLEGVAINFCCIDEMDDMKAIEAQIGKKIPELKSDWPMTVFQKKVKEKRQPRPSKREDRARKFQENDTSVADVTKVKDISLNGRAVQKKSKYQYNANRFGQSKDTAFGKDKRKNASVISSKENQSASKEKRSTSKENRSTGKDGRNFGKDSRNMKDSRNKNQKPK